MKFFKFFKCFLFPKMVWNGFSENGSEWNSDFFFFQKWFGMKFQSVLFWKWFGKVFHHSKMVCNGIPRVFSLPRNGSEQNSEVFLFQKTDGIQTKLPSVLSCFVFCGIIFLSENGNPNCSRFIVLKKLHFCFAHPFFCCLYCIKW